MSVTRMLIIGFIGLFIVGTSSATDAPAERPAPFVAGEGGYPIYRIPAIAVANDGSVLAFAEGRASLSDHAENNIVLRRSTDAGQSWLPLQVVAEDGKHCLNNPTVVVLRETGRVLLMYQRYPAGKHEAAVKPGVAGDDTCLSFIVTSDDHGKSWSKPLDITPQVKPATGATSVATGPGVGIELRRGKHAGRIVFPFNHGPAGKWDVYAAYSDDGGKTWAHGSPAAVSAGARGNEVQMVELSDGRVLLNSRGSAGRRLRKVALSEDGGATWSPLRDEPAHPEPVCQGSILRLVEPKAGDKGAILFVNPASTKGRVSGVVRLSRDDGETWPVSRELVPGEFAYSGLTVLHDGSVLCIYETEKYRRINVVRFTTRWLEADPTKNSGHQPRTTPH